MKGEPDLELDEVSKPVEPDTTNGKDHVLQINWNDYIVDFTGPDDPV